MLRASGRKDARTEKIAMRVFHASIIYLTILCVAIGVDVFLPL
jgi:heme O synthase-like polyprenyltransferase